MDELKPCPFCGGHARMNIVMDSVGVSCRLCGASLIDETREDAIAAWNARAPADDWRDIESAPRDGTQFLAYYRAMNVRELTWWTGTQWARFGGTAQPDLWMPLPAAPEVGK